MEKNEKNEKIMELRKKFITSDYVKVNLSPAGWRIFDIDFNEEEARTILEKLLKDKDEKVQVAAVRALGQIGAVQSVPALIELRRYKDDLSMDFVISNALAKMKEEIEKVVLPLVEILEDKNTSMRRWVAYELGKIHALRAIPNLIEALRKEKDFTVKWAIAGALSTLKATEAIEPLKEIVRKEEDLLDKYKLAIELAEIEGRNGEGFNIATAIREGGIVEYELDIDRYDSLLKKLNTHEKVESIREEFGSLKQIVTSQPESKERIESLEKISSLEEKLDETISQIILEMRKETTDPLKTKEYTEALKNLGMVKQESWLKRNIVTLVGSTLTFIAASIAAILSYLKL